MVQCAYNPQEALHPLMQRYGRRLRCDGKADGLSCMVTAVSEALRVDRSLARQLVESLISAGLLSFEHDEPAVSVAPNEQRFAPPGPARGPTSPSGGVWCIGPRA